MHDTKELRDHNPIIADFDFMNSSFNEYLCIEPNRQLFDLFHTP